MNNMITKPLFQYALDMVNDFRRAVKNGNDIKSNKIERELREICGVFQDVSNAKTITKIMSQEPGTSISWRYIEKKVAKEIEEKE